MQRTWTEDEALLLSLSLERRERALKEGDERRQCFVMDLQLQEDKEMAEQQAILDTDTEQQTTARLEPLGQELQAREAVIQANRRFAAQLSNSDHTLLSDHEYSEHLQAVYEQQALEAQALWQGDREYAAQLSPSDHTRTLLSDHEYAKQLQAENEQQALEAQALWQGDREYAAQLSNSNRITLSDREYAERLQAERPQQEFLAPQATLEADRELALRLSGWDPVTLSDRNYAEQLQAGGNAVEVPIAQLIDGFAYNKSPKVQVQSDSGEPQFLQTRNDKAFATRLQEEEDQRFRTEEETAQREIRAWQNVEQDASPKAHASKQGSTTLPGQARKARAVQTPTHASNESGDCSICGDTFSQTKLVRPCEHFYCRNCLAGTINPSIITPVTHPLSKTGLTAPNPSPFQTISNTRSRTKQLAQCCQKPTAPHSHPDAPRRRLRDQLSTPRTSELKTPHSTLLQQLPYAAPLSRHTTSTAMSACAAAAAAADATRHGPAATVAPPPPAHPHRLCPQEQGRRSGSRPWGGKKGGWKHCPKCGHFDRRGRWGCLQHGVRVECKEDFCCWNCLKKSSVCKGKCPR